MVKTKIVNKKAPAKKVKEPMEVKPNKNYHPKGDWWEDIMSGETCRTGNFDKVVSALGRSRDDLRGLNVQAIPDRGVMYWYITLIVTETETKKKGSKK